ncbi:MAG: hypothetical protein KC503_15090 [Myxococcales bacterium]|nr:hypothetical protein [Myxococcales bacterium]
MRRWSSCLVVLALALGGCVRSSSGGDASVDLGHRDYYVDSTLDADSAPLPDQGIDEAAPDQALDQPLDQALDQPLDTGSETSSDGAADTSSETSPDSTVDTTSPDSTVDTTSPDSTVDTTSPDSTVDTAPPLTCPELLDWTTLDYPAAALTASFALGDGTASVTSTGNTSAYQANTPDDNTTLTGSATNIESLSLTTDFGNASESVVVSIDVSGFAGGGARSASFTIYDIDSAGSGNGRSVDRITVVGLRNSAIVTPTLTLGSALTSVNATTVEGTQSVANNADIGNLGVSFTAPIDTIRITYTNGTGAGSDPDSQSVGVGSLTFTPIGCP